MRFVSSIFVFVFILIFFQTACGQSQNISNDSQKLSKEIVDPRIENLKTQANEMYSAFDKKDFDKFVELIHPKAMEKVGSRENLIAMMKSVAEENPKVFKTFSMTAGNPQSLVESEGELFGVIPQKIEGITHGNHKIVQDSCVVGVSEDGGKNWKFVSGDKFYELFPAMKDKIQIIPQKTFSDGIEQ